jgi:hypothetical protein
MRLTSGLRHSFFFIELAPSKRQHLIENVGINNRRWPKLQGLAGRFAHQPLSAKFREQLVELVCALFRSHFVTVKQGLANLSHRAGRAQQLPDRLCDFVEAEARAGFRIEGHQLILQIGFQQEGRALVGRIVHCHPLPWQAPQIEREDSALEQPLDAIACGT